MANTAQAKKRARQAEKARRHNASQRSGMRTLVKNVSKALAAGDKSRAATVYQIAVPVIDRMARKGMIHKNKAARHKSRLNQRLRTLPSAQ